MSIDAKRRYAAAAFISLLLLSVFWPSPIVSSNRLWLNYVLSVDELSFLGREAPSWDVVFWCMAGLLALLMIGSGEWERRRRDRLLQWIRAARFHWSRRFTWSLAASFGAVALVWTLADQTVLAWCERMRFDGLGSVIRFVNRFGGGMNPVLVILFFLLGGMLYRHDRWMRYALAMAMAGLGGGAVAHILKLAAGRSRPELWLGPFHFARHGADSFPSGHTVGAFAIAGVLILASPSRVVRAVSLILASAVGLSRVLAFRHWLSDVLASACIGLLAASIALSAFPMPATEDSEEKA